LVYITDAAIDRRI